MFKRLLKDPLIKSGRAVFPNKGRKFVFAVIYEKNANFYSTVSKTKEYLHLLRKKAKVLYYSC